MGQLDLTDKKFEIAEQILLCEALIIQANKIYAIISGYEPSYNDHKKHLNYINHAIVHFWKLTANLYVNECISGLFVLLDTDPSSHKTIKNLLKELGSPEDAEQDLSAIITKFKATGLLQIRHNFIAHRPKSTSFRRDIIFSTFKSEYRKACLDIISEIKAFWGQHIDVGLGNNYILNKLDHTDSMVGSTLKNAIDSMDNK